MLEGALDLLCMGIAFARKNGEVMYANHCARGFLDTYSQAARPPRGRGAKLAIPVARASGATRSRHGEHGTNLANGHLLIDIQPLQVETDGSSILDVAGAPC